MNIMQFSLEFSDMSPVAHLTTDYLQQALVATLYHIGKLSAHQACSILQLSHQQFAELLLQFGFSIIPTTTEIESNNRYYFQDLLGQLQWTGDAVGEQKKLRDEW